VVPGSGFVEDSAFGWLVGVSEAVFCGHVGVAAEAAAALGTLHDGAVSRPVGREGIDNDLFDPFGVVTGTTAVSVPFAGSGPRPVHRVLSVL
jgi:hypothetical protein